MYTTLKTSKARVTLGRPRSTCRSACITEYALADGRQVFKTPVMSGPFDVASLPMVPWCNRISGGVETPVGFYAISPNVSGQDCPLHGSGFQSEWQVEQECDNRLVKSLRSRTPAPFDFQATQDVKLSGADLTITLSVTHKGEMPLPYGLGVHPWFPRSSGTTLQATSSWYQAVNEAMLPTRDVEIDQRPEWNFSNGGPLPDGLIDTCFGGWDGRAILSWPDRGMELSIETAPAAKWYQVYSPAPDCGFFCFEPVTHPINAHNTPGKPGLSILEKDASMDLSVTFRPRDL